MDARMPVLLRVALAAKEFRRWDAIGALTSGDRPHADDAQDNLRELDDALDAALRAGALAPLTVPAELPDGAEELHQAIVGVIHAARLMAHWHFAPMISDPFVREVAERDERALRVALQAVDALLDAGRYAPLSAKGETQE